MKRAVMRDAVSSQQFYFRKSLVPEDEEEAESSHAAKPKSHDHEYTLMDVNAIINGKVSSVTAPKYLINPACYYNIIFYLFAGRVSRPLVSSENVCEQY